MIDRQIQLHQSQQDHVIVKRTSEKLTPFGFAITKDDELLSQTASREPGVIRDIKVAEKIANENRFLKSQAFFSRDRSLTHGQKPIKKFTNINDALPEELAKAKENERNTGE
jgi:hypothetical protein